MTPAEALEGEGLTRPGLRAHVGRVGLTPWQLCAIAFVVVLGFGVAAYWVISRAPSVATPASVIALATESESASGASAGTGRVSGAGGAPTGAPTGGPDGGSGGEPGAGGGVLGVTVDVSGKVRHPGVRTLPMGSRVVDALEAAGGAKRGIDLSGINQARLLIDGEQIRVGLESVGGSAVAPSSTLSGPGSTSTGTGQSPANPTLVNLNTASQAELDTLPGVGPVTAQSIIAYRDAQGGFRSSDELLDVDGIGEATLAKLQPLVTV